MKIKLLGIDTKINRLNVVIFVQICAEFHRIVNVNLKNHFYAVFDQYIPGLLSLLRQKAGRSAVLSDALNQLFIIYDRLVSTNSVLFFLSLVFSLPFKCLVFSPHMSSFPLYSPVTFLLSSSHLSSVPFSYLRLVTTHSHHFPTSPLLSPVYSPPLLSVSFLFTSLFAYSPPHFHPQLSDLFLCFSHVSLLSLFTDFLYLFFPSLY